MLYRLAVLIFFSISVTVSLLPLNTTFVITLEVLNKYRSRCVYMIQTTEKLGK
jgi:hypothetical protein